MTNQMLMYVGGGAALGYFMGPGIFPGGPDPMTSALYGAALGYVVEMYMASSGNGQKKNGSSSSS